MDHAGSGVIQDQLMLIENGRLYAAHIAVRSAATGSLESVPNRYYGSIQLLAAGSTYLPEIMQLAHGPIGGIISLAWYGSFLIDSPINLRFRIFSNQAINFHLTAFMEPTT